MLTEQKSCEYFYIQLSRKIKQQKINCHREGSVCRRGNCSISRLRPHVCIFISFFMRLAIHPHESHGNGHRKEIVLTMFTKVDTSQNFVFLWKASNIKINYLWNINNRLALKAFPYRRS